MQRHSRKLRNLVAKSERKVARSRRPGSKAKRYKQQIERYTALVEGRSDGRAQSRKPVAAEEE
jgi:hypothetical protein